MSHTDDDQLPACLASARQAVEQLSAMYQQLSLEGEGKNFMTEIFAPMLASQPDPNDLEDQLENGEVSNLDLMKVSCAYVVGAISAETAGNHENAWLAVSHAQYWMGMAYGLGFMKGAAKTALNNRARAGGLKRNENNYGAVKEYALKLALQHLDGTALNAARQIKDDVINFQRKNHPFYALGERTPETRIAGWLRVLPFKGKRGPRKSNLKG